MLVVAEKRKQLITSATEGFQEKMALQPDHKGISAMKDVLGMNIKNTDLHHGR